MTDVSEWTVQPEGMPDLEREVRSEARAAKVATAMMIALMPAFGMPPRIKFTRNDSKAPPIPRP